ncbi:hypothetical protein SYJ56_02690 [Algoriphagus sp. D3-2-R+10]|uniref:hypothetical protein n=1 Tax=Algoriphagus aurantiacus TaxID=3103948 RepID=UPI002B3DCA8F|nr:hypothetical protein [Algoriphagus sp. D3-2-R+10]MEB2774194.1 hypothetical protein [Algoriphagus sp. D3-2-R+10]
MIKFFRKIRQSLLHDNKFSKYLLYAIGEIILVVIGILIALQINTWNEWRKDRIKEDNILHDLAKNIEINIQTFQNDINLLEEWGRSSEIIILALGNKTVYSDTLRNHFHLARITKQKLFVSNIGFQAYKDYGLDLITNKNLSAEIIKLYEFTIPSILSTNDLVNEVDAEWDNYIVQNFDFVEGVGLTPNDYESLFADHYYVSWVKAYNQGRKSLIKTDQILIKECENVLQLIQNELKKSNSQ